MSFEASLWAMKDAPTATVNEYAVLACMAEAAWDDGCDAFLSQKTISERTHVDVQTVRRTIRGLVKRGLLAKGDQRVVAQIPRNYRPVNYDLMIPAAWFPNLDRVNRDRRLNKGRDPLTADSRPWLGSAPERPRRRDAKPVAGVSDRYLGGDSQTPPPMDQGYLQDTSEVSTRSVGGDSQMGRRYVVDTQPSPDPVLTLTTPQSSSVVTVTVPGARGGEEEEKGSGGLVLTPAMRDALDLLHRVPTPAGRRGMTYTEMLELLPMVVRCLGEPGPWSKAALLHELSRDLVGVQHLPSLLLHRLTTQIDPFAEGDAEPRLPAPVPAQVLVGCVECDRPMKGPLPADGMCVQCRVALQRATVRLVDQVEQLDLVDVDAEGQVPGQLGVPVEYQQAREALRRSGGEGSSPAPESEE